MDETCTSFSGDQDEEWVSTLAGKAASENLPLLAEYLLSNRHHIARLRKELRQKPYDLSPSPFIYTLR
jgi:hypothetical protein